MVPRPPTADAGLGTEPETDAAATDGRTSDEADRTATRGPRRTAADADPAPAAAAGGADAKTPARPPR